MVVRCRRRANVYLFFRVTEEVILTHFLKGFSPGGSIKLAKTVPNHRFVLSPLEVSSTETGKMQHKKRADFTT